MFKKNKTNLCGVCGGTLETKKVSYEQYWKDKLVLFEKVPARVCLSCGETWFGIQVMKEIDQALAQKIQPTKEIKVPVWSFPTLCPA